MFELRQSDINGTGVFATQDIPSGTELGIWCCKDVSKGVRYLYNEGMECKWYETAILGRYCNNSDSPNTSLIVNEELVNQQLRALAESQDLSHFIL